MSVTWDVVVVGAGPAGSLAALTALRYAPGARILILDRDDFPRDKVCGDGVGPACFDVLLSAGLSGLFDDYPPAAEMALESRTIQARHPIGGPFRTVPREVFDDRLLAAAITAGATFQRRRVQRVDVHPSGVVLDGEIESRAVVGADGAESVVRRQLGLPPPKMALAIRGYGPSTTDAPRIVSQGHDWPAYAWEFPIGNGQSNIGYLDVPGIAKPVTREFLLAAASELLPGAASGVSSWKGHRLPLASARPRVLDGRVILAGDAAALVNPGSGEGLMASLTTGSLAGEAALMGARAGAVYRKRLRGSLGRHQWEVALGARLCRNDALAALGLRMARADRVFFESVLDLSMGDGTIRSGVTATALAKVAVRGRRASERSARAEAG